MTEQLLVELHLISEKQTNKQREFSVTVLTQGLWKENVFHKLLYMTS